MALKVSATANQASSAALFDIETEGLISKINLFPIQGRMLFPGRSASAVIRRSFDLVVYWDRTYIPSLCINGININKY
jgi:hypothetical protein